MSDGAESPVPSGPGAVLKAAREKLGYSVQDMADALNLTVRVVSDLEADRWDRLPAATFARGYVRAYAKLVGVDGDALIAGHAGFGDRAEPPAAVVRPARAIAAPRGLADLAARQPGPVISGAVVAAVCVVLVVLYLVWPETGTRSGEARDLAALPARSGGPNAYVPAAGGSRAAAGSAQPAPAAATVRQPGVAPRGEQSASRPVAASEPADEPARPPADDAARNDARTVASAPVPARVPAPEDTTDDVLADVEDDGLDAVHAAAARPPQSLVRRISPEGEDRVDFEFSEDCWVEVADAGGRNFSDLARAGDTLVLVGQAPFRIRLGYGPGASVAFNGQVVALAPHTRRSNVTFLVLDPAAGEVDE